MKKIDILPIVLILLIILISGYIQGQDNYIQEQDDYKYNQEVSEECKIFITDERYSSEGISQRNKLKSEGWIEMSENDENGNYIIDFDYTINRTCFLLGYAYTGKLEVEGKETGVTGVIAGAPAADFLVTNNDTGECKVFWPGDERIRYELPAEWEYTDFATHNTFDYVLKNDEEYGEAMCEKLGYRFGGIEDISVGEYPIAMIFVKE